MTSYVNVEFRKISKNSGRIVYIVELSASL